MSKFTAITWGEMHEFLAGEGFKLLNPPRGVLPAFVREVEVACGHGTDFSRTVELVYGKRVGELSDGLTLRVYTTLTPREGEVREKGTDAIRVVLFHRHVVRDGAGNETPQVPVLVGGEKKCLRVKGWRSNLGKRIAGWSDMVGPKCPRCGRPMVLREGPKGDFWGCSGFDRMKPVSCRTTLPAGVPVPPAAPSGPSCGKCNRPMVLKMGQYGKFMGCTGFPVCRVTAAA